VHRLDGGDRRIHGDEVGLFAVSAAYGLGFSGIVPAYVLAVRELFPSVKAVMAGADTAVRQRVRDGLWRLVRRRALRPFRLLRAGLCCGGDVGPR